jgi:hypothetical protein
VSLRSPSKIAGRAQARTAHRERFNDDAANIKDAQLEWIAKAKHASAIERADQALALLRTFLLGQA